ncbi:TPA: Gfo/Idh/MocA family oxidoreductase [Candidatus Poribacteria bacterium]|nr:Gfo/Idh/MocA family oxidoreductase [Candidatus Poribacteria bacterium]
MQRIALIGCGRIAPAHLDGLKSLSSRASVVAICDMNEKLRRERQQAYNIPNGFASVAELLEWNKFDIAAVLTPPDVRAEVCVPVLKARKCMLVEKPFSLSLDEARTIVQTAEQAGVVLAVNQNFRWIQPAPILREHILNGKIGKVLSVLLADTVWRDETSGWRNKTAKLALSVMGIHWLDRIRWITGDEGARIYTCSLVSQILTSAGEDITSTVITLRSNAVATLVHHWASHSRGVNNSLQVDGTDGSVIAKRGELIWMGRTVRRSALNLNLGNKMT